jgi:FMN reductase
LFDLVDAGPGVGAFTRDELPKSALDILGAIEAADALIVGSPVYKGSYAGLLKHLFDFVDPLCIAGKPVLLLATGAGERHALVGEHHLRPLFGFFSALTIPTYVYASDSDFRDGTLQNLAVVGRAAQAADEMASLLAGPALSQSVKSAPPVLLMRQN